MPKTALPELCNGYGQILNVKVKKVVIPTKVLYGSCSVSTEGLLTNLLHYPHLCRARIKCLYATCLWCWDSCRQTEKHLANRCWRVWIWHDKPSSWMLKTGHPGVRRVLDSVTGSVSLFCVMQVLRLLLFLQLSWEMPMCPCFSPADRIPRCLNKL